MTMMAWRSPVDAAPPSIGVEAVKGYGPGSLSDAYWKLTAVVGVEELTTVHGMPYGLLGSPEGPKSGCRLVPDAFMAASHWALYGLTGSPVTGVFQAASLGNDGHDVPGIAGPVAARAGCDCATGSSARSPVRAAAVRAIRADERSATSSSTASSARP